MLIEAFLNTWSVVAIILLILGYTLMLCSVHFNWNDSIWKWIIFPIFIASVIIGFIGGIHCLETLDKHIIFV